MKRILALDLGTNCGYAIFNGRNIKSGTINLKPNRFQSSNQRFKNFQDFLIKIQKESGTIGLHTVYYEEVRKHLGTDAYHIYGAFWGQVLTFCANYKLDYQGVPVGTLKKHITGKGNADKEAVIKAVRNLGFNPKDDNEADALAVLDYALKREGIIYSPKVK